MWNRINLPLIKIKTISNFIKSSQFLSTKPKEQIYKMDIKNVVEKLNAFAPLRLAENWDNVGLLIEPHTPRYKDTSTTKKHI